MNTATTHRRTKRRFITRWMEARLRRLDAAIDKGGTPRQHARRHELANEIQIAWAKRDGLI